LRQLYIWFDRTPPLFSLELSLHVRELVFQESKEVRALASCLSVYLQQINQSGEVQYLKVEKSKESEISGTKVILRTL
jgi:hypothetical protein